MPFSPSRSPALNVHSPRSPPSIPFSPRSPNASVPSQSAPMSISAARRPSPPPPLPPPRYIEEFNHHHDAQRPSSTHHAGDEDQQSQQPSGPQIKTGSSLLGGMHRPPGKQFSGTQRDIDFNSPASPSSQSINIGGSFDAGDAGRQDIQSPSSLIEYSKLHGERHMGQRSLERSSQAYDKAIVSRIGNPPRSAGGLSADDPASPSRAQDAFKRLNNGQLKPLSLPERHSTSNEEKWSASLASPSTLSPGLPILRSPLSEQDQERYRNYRGTHLANQNEPNRPRRESYSESGMFGDMDQTSESGAQEQNKADHSPATSENQKAGQKRRANSPPPDSIDPQLRPNQSRDNWPRRQSPSSESRQQQHLRFQDQQSAQSLSSTVSSGVGQNGNSYQSSIYGLSNPSTAATSYTSDQINSYQQSPLSNQQRLDARQDNPQPGQLPMDRGSTLPHRRNGSSGVRGVGVFICDCCPKKPKKFETAEELRVHEMEKQYYCQYCHNRFKNKNEAERHQNSLHLRKHSWSCSALASYDAAFHPTTTNSAGLSIGGGGAGVQNQPYPAPTATDTCGYCGAEFPNPPNLEERYQHLNHVHKFGECNQNKKFFRADHFRQHLKHSHAGTSGKWTNMLENACMREEELPQPINQGQSGGLSQPGIGIPQGPPPIDPNSPQQQAQPHHQQQAQLNLQNQQNFNQSQFSQNSGNHNGGGAPMANMNQAQSGSNDQMQQ